jgi:site-specific DNA-cytosine methylase
MIDLETILALAEKAKKAAPAKAKPRHNAKATGLSVDKILGMAERARRQAPRPTQPRHPSGSLEGFSVSAAMEPEGRPSDAVRRWLRTHPGDKMRRGELLARARAVMLGVPGREAHLPKRPTQVALRDPARWGYPSWNDSEPWNSQPLLTMECFAGGGLFSLASALEGNIELEDCELDRDAVKTRARNRSLLRMVGEARQQDARTWRPDTRTPDGLDLLFGGPPCKAFSQGASLARRKKGWESKDNFFPITLDWICDLQPRAVVFENSPKLFEKADFRDQLELWQEQLDHLGYASSAHVLDSASFGNPTMRRRTFVFAWPKGAPWGRLMASRPEGMFAKPGSPEVQRGEKMPWKPMRDRLIGGCCGGWGLVDCVFLGGFGLQCRSCREGRNFVPAPNTSGDQGRQEMASIKVDTNRGRVPWAEWMKKTVGSRQPRFDKFVPADIAGAWVKLKTEARDLRLPGRRVSEYLSRTVVPNFFNKAEGLLIPPEVNPDDYSKSRQWSTRNIGMLKRMSARDVAKLQDVPQWYGIEGGRTAVFTQLGMGVPINLGRGVHAHIRRAMGLPIRAPWWEVEVPKTPRRIRFQTQEQISQEQSGELRPGTGSGRPDGLWPTEAFSMCFAVPPTLDHGLLLQDWVEDDWQDLIVNRMVGAQEQRRLGHSKLDRGLREPLTSQQRKAGQQRGRQIGEVLTPDGLDYEALWKSGYRGPISMPPDNLASYSSFSGHDVVADEWGEILRYGDGPYRTVLGVHLRLTDPETVYLEESAWGTPWYVLVPLDDPLPTDRRVLRQLGIEGEESAVLDALRKMDKKAARGLSGRDLRSAPWVLLSRWIQGEP